MTKKIFQISATNDLATIETSAKNPKITLTNPEQETFILNLPTSNSLSNGETANNGTIIYQDSPGKTDIAAQILIFFGEFTGIDQIINKCR